MTIPAVLTMYLWGQAFFALTGTYYFYQAYVPIAVFLAMHLLITDPSTSPRTQLGRILYGVLYALTVIVVEVTIEPSFPAKLMLVPALNLLVRLIDRLAQSRVLRPFDPGRIAPQVTGRRRNLAYIAIWAAVFSMMVSLRGIGDRFPGQDLPFWKTACGERLPRSCAKLAFAANLVCRHAGWGCNTLALLSQGGPRQGDVPALLSKACELGFEPGCENVERFKRGGELVDADPTATDYRIILSLFKMSQRPELSAMSPSEVYAEACRRGWTAACGH
jgi:hypothetical protein